MYKKVAFNVFYKNNSNYIGRTMKYVNKVLCDVKYPITDYEKNSMPKDLPIV